MPRHICSAFAMHRAQRIHIAMNSIHSTQLDLNLLKTFDALFVTRSASRAAAALGVGQPAVSHALGRLRNAIGDPLFVRAAGRMEPTARARRLVEPVREALMAAGRALSIEESFDPAHDRRIFSVSASDSLQPVLFSRVLSDLAAAGMRPALRLRSLDRDATLIALDEGERDLAVGYLPRVRRWHEREVLYEEGHVCLFNPDLLRLPVPVPVEAFAEFGHIVPSLRGEMTSFVDEVLDERGLRRRVVATTAQFMAIPMMLKQVPAIATLPARFAHFCANAAALATSPLPFPSPTFAVSMVWHRRDAGSLSIAWLRGRVRAAVGMAPNIVAC
jgi:LysR family transcriptional activator of mexEF-oprN operon